jgi:AcrR family transcriptional regulator
MTKKQELIKAAFNLFCEKGFHASGIDLILKEAEISKMTLYNHFSTKDDLILEVLNYAHEIFVKNVLEKVSALKIKPKSKIIKLIEIIEESTKKKKAIRCIFINASAEFPDLKNPIHKAASAHKLLTESYIKNLLKEAKLKNSEYLSKVIHSLLQGALVMTQVTGEKTYYADVKKAVSNLLKS